MAISIHQELDQQLITEGETKLWIVKNEFFNQSQHSGPGNARVPVYYTPVMEFSRDLSILVVEQFLNEKKTETSGNIKLLDGLAGTGVRGVRFGNEIQFSEESDIEIIINDHNPLAFKLIKKNIDLNQLSNTSALKKNLNSILIKERFDYIDIDPFGSPINFIDSATRMLRNHGILAITATDTATLFGTYPKTCLRRYDAWSCRAPFSHELGPRILIGSCARIAAKHNLGLEPLLVHSRDYYYRVYLRGIRGRSAADETINQLGFIQIKKGSNKYNIFKRERSCLNNVFHGQKHSIYIAGPLWIGSLFSSAFLKSFRLGNHKFGTKKQITKLLPIWQDEVDFGPGFYDANLLAAELKISTPPLQLIIDALKDNGYVSSRTHFNSNAFKTNADFEDICKIIKKIG